MNRARILSLILVGSLGVWVGSGEGQLAWKGGKILISIHPEAVTEQEAIWAASAPDEQAAKVLGPRTGLKDFDVIGQQFGLLWIEQIGGDHQFYGLHFPFESPFEDPWYEVVMRYSQLPFTKFATVFYPIPVEQNPHEDELVLIKVGAEAVAEIEAIWPLSSFDKEEAQQLGVRVGLAEFDAIGVRFGLFWVERAYGDKQLYGLHFPLGSLVEAIIATYARLPFIDHAGPGRIPVVILSDDTGIENVTWGRIKHRMNRLTQGGRQ